MMLRVLLFKFFWNKLLYLLQCPQFEKNPKASHASHKCTYILHPALQLCIVFVVGTQLLTRHTVHMYYHFAICIVIEMLYKLLCLLSNIVSFAVICNAVCSAICLKTFHKQISRLEKLKKRHSFTKIQFDVYLPG